MRVLCIRYATGIWKWEVVIEYQGFWSTLLSIIIPMWKPKAKTMTFLGKRQGLWYKMPEVQKVDRWTNDYLDAAVISWMHGRIPNCGKDVPRSIETRHDETAS